MKQQVVNLHFLGRQIILEIYNMPTSTNDYVTTSLMPKPGLVMGFFFQIYSYARTGRPRWSAPTYAHSWRSLLWRALSHLAPVDFVISKADKHSVFIVV